MPPETDQWYVTHLAPHLPMLRAWLRSQFPQERDVDDVVQEAVLRVWRMRQLEGEIRAPKAFLFATARNLVISGKRKATRQGQFSFADLDELGVLDEDEHLPAALAKAEELELLTQAIQSLPSRCRQVITLKKIYGLSQQAIADELGISINTVDTQGAIGMRKLTEYFRRLEEKEGRRHG